MPIANLINEPAAFLYSLLQRAPAILLALILHEMAHGWVAYKLGDPTAKQLGRLSLNPMRHLDPIGTAMLVLAGFGWAKPVPINPAYFKKPHRDDLLVSLAGVTMNLLLCLAGMILMYAMLTVGIRALPADAWISGERFLYEMDGTTYAMPLSMAYTYAYGASEFLIAPYLGAGWSFLYEVLVNIVVIDLSLALFNLMPIPPLDGYHVLNDLVLKGTLFATRKVQLIGQAALLILLFTGVLNDGLSWVLGNVLQGAGNVFCALYGALGII